MHFGDRPDLLSVGGEASNSDSQWADTKREVFECEKWKILATVVEIAVNVVTSTNVFNFCVRFSLQRPSGPMGLTSTASLAGLIMKLWDVA